MIMNQVTKFLYKKNLLFKKLDEELEDENISAYNQWILPSKELHGIWER